MRRRRRQRLRHSRATIIATCVAILWFGFVVGVTASNSVPLSRAGQTTQAITADTLKPTECAALTLTNLVLGNNGTAGNDLILGTSGINAMSGSGGNDCILGGGGADVIDGGTGTDVCIGGPGLDSFVGCETQIQ